MVCLQGRGILHGPRAVRGLVRGRCPVGIDFGSQVLKALRDVVKRRDRLVHGNRPIAR
jgi:hypothetical protein